MAGLKTLNDAPAKKEAGDKTATGDAKDGAATPPETATEGADKAEVEAQKGDAAADHDAIDPAIEQLTAERDAALAKADKIEADYLAQSDKLAETNAALAKAADGLAERDKAADLATATIAKLEAQIKALGSEPPAPPADAEIKRPKVGKTLKLPEEGKRAKGDVVQAALAKGDLLVVVLADDNAVVQPFPAMIGGLDLFTDATAGLLVNRAVDLQPDAEAVSMRYAVLLDADGKVLSSCRLGALLLGGGGYSAMIPPNNLRFEFD